MFSLTQFLLDILILIVVFSAYVIITIRWKPRLWLHDFPADIQALALPKTAEEKRLTNLMAVPLLVLFFGLPIFMLWRLKATLGASFNFGVAWLYAYALFFSINLWDLVILDWIGTSLIDPQHPPVVGTEGAAGWRDYAFHFRGFLKGCVFGLVFATIEALVVALLA
jgi:hypothetical protein